MSKINLTPNASGTGVFTIASPNSNTDRTLNLPDEAGTFLTTSSDLSGNTIIPNDVTAFRALLTSNQSSPSAFTWTKIALNNEIIDTKSAYDPTTNYRFTAPVTGYYQLNAGIAYESFTNNGGYILAIRKNGSTFMATVGNVSSGSSARDGTAFSGVASLTANDYLELWVYQNMVRGISAATETFLDGHLIGTA